MKRRTFLGITLTTGVGAVVGADKWVTADELKDQYAKNTEFYPSSTDVKLELINDRGGPSMAFNPITLPKTKEYFEFAMNGLEIMLKFKQAVTFSPARIADTIVSLRVHWDTIQKFDLKMNGGGRDVVSLDTIIINRS